MVGVCAKFRPLREPLTSFFRAMGANMTGDDKCEDFLSAERYESPVPLRPPDPGEDVSVEILDVSDAPSVSENAEPPSGSAERDDSDCEFVGVVIDRLAVEFPARSRKRRGFCCDRLRDSPTLEITIDDILGPFAVPPADDDDDVPLASFALNQRRRLEANRVIDTIDLSSHAFKPTPDIREVIVIDPEGSRSETVTSSSDASSSATDRPADADSFASRGCPVCLEKFSAKRTIVSTFCGHVFCSPCMTIVMRNDKTCPTCRRKLKGKGYHNLFL